MKKRNPNPERSELLHPLVSLLLFDKEKPDFSANKTCKLSPSYFKFSEVPDLIRSENFALKLDSFFKLLTLEQRDKLISQLVKSIKFEIVYKGVNALRRPNYEMYDFDTEESQENYRKELKVFIETGNVRDFLIIYFALFFEDIFKHYFEIPDFVSEDEYNEVLGIYAVIE